MYKYFTIISFLSASIAHAAGEKKFLADRGETAQSSAAVTCTAPENIFPHIYGLHDFDTYVASNSPDFSSGYSAQSPLWFGNGAPLVLAKTAAITANEKVAQALGMSEQNTYRMLKKMEL